MLVAAPAVNRKRVAHGRISETRWLLDFLKVLAVVLLVVGHCIQFVQGEAILQGRTLFDDWAFRSIYSFHMSLFVLISGWLFGDSIERHGLSAQMLVHRCLPLVAVNSALVLRVESMSKGAIVA